MAVNMGDILDTRVHESLVVLVTRAIPGVLQVEIIMTSLSITTRVDGPCSRESKMTLVHTGRVDGPWKL